MLNDPPYGTERSYNGLRLAGALAKREATQAWAKVLFEKRWLWEWFAVTLMIAGCATASRSPAHGPVAAVCTDSIYLHLARQHPDSLSERAWQRLQSLDSSCARERAHAASDTRGMGMMGMAHGPRRAWAILAPLIIVGMMVMMVALRL